MDIDMPVKDGYQTTEEIINLFKTTQVDIEPPIIIGFFN